MRRSFDERLRPIAKRREGLRQRYERDPFAHLEDGHVKVLDLAPPIKEVVLDPWSHQEEIVRSWVDLDYLARTGALRFRNVWLEKSRQMGVTWITAYVMWWALTYHAIPGLAVSRVSADVDDGGNASSTDSIFGRIRFIHERVPMRFRLPLRFRQQPESIILNPQRSLAFLIGEGQTTDPGRGGKFGFCFLDEASRLSWGDAVQQAVVNACPQGRFYNSTHYGEDNLYYRLGETRDPEMVYLRHHWSRHPLYSRGLHLAGSRPTKCKQCFGTVNGLKWSREDPVAHRYPGKLTSPWYERAHAQFTDEQVAMELDIDPARALPARVFHEFAEDTHVVPEILYEPLIPTELSFDYGVGAPTAVGIWQEHTDAYCKIGEFEQADLTPDQVAAGIKQELARLMMRAGHYDAKLLKPEWTRQLLAVGDPAGEARELATARPLASDYARLGFSISAGQIAPTTRIIAVKRMLMGIPKPLRISRAGCPKTIKHFKAHRYPTDRAGNRKPGERPLEDEHKHMMDADGYLITWKFPPPMVDELMAAALDDASGKLDEAIGYGMRL
jgi:hypothetical protein